MNFKKYLYIFLALIIAVSSFEAADAYAASKKRSKARTTQTSKKRKSSRKSSKKRSTTRKKRSAYTAQAKPAPKPETPSNDSLTLLVNDAILEWIPSNLNPGGLRVNSVRPNKSSKTAFVSLNENFTYLPVTRELIDSLSRHVSSTLPDSIADFRISLNVGQRGLAYYITKVDKLPAEHRKNPPFVKEANPYVVADKGMENDIIALWHSHGRYFKPGSGSWMWQRPLLFQSIEDTYTMGYILPFVVPMLENAGAYVMLPRERDVNPYEVIVDNDTNDEGQVYSQPYYKEMTGQNPWITGELDGFIYDLPDFRDTENPFENGTYRQTNTIHKGRPSVAAWYADIPKDGEYAVYVSYKTLPNSTEDARYTVNYDGGSKEFIVNQTMGGGTWIYLGTFPLTQGFSDTEPVVTLTNISDEEGRIVTADAVKIGGGMGNIARSNHRSDVYFDPSTPEKNLASTASDSTDDMDLTSGETADEAETDSVPSRSGDTSVLADPTVTGETYTKPKPNTPPSFRTSGLPRFLEGARYWLHWAGFPESVYSPYHGTDDYKDDYTSRGHWVNYLAGGSRVLPDNEGLNIPVDMAFALHSDAGKKADDSFVGTLGIYFTQNGDSYKDGTPRINSRMLTDLVMRQISNDIRKQYEPAWVRRSMWDKTYVEARVPEVPTTLIELMSHQNFADMQYGLDPAFRFTVGRAIYKGIARFLAERKDRDLVIQPLPVKDFAIQREKKNHYRLSWQPTPDPLEDTAMPDKYIILERSGDELGFHKIGETSHTHFNIKTTDDDIHSFRIIAVNKGGQSFPSETLAFREAPGDEKPVLVVNGFSRVSGPSHFSDGNRAGFNAEEDFGVPYIRDISFTGYQTEFNRNAGESFGRSNSNYVSDIIAGNTFDYPAVHGKAITAAGKGFVSASTGAVERGDIDLRDYEVVDLILGKQKSTVVGNGRSGVKYHTFTPALESIISKYTDKGGRMIVTGEYVVSDLFGTRYSQADRDFAEDVLGVVPMDSVSRPRSGRLRTSDGRSVDYSSTLRSDYYIVENPDVLAPAEGVDATPIFTFSDNSLPAAYLIDNGKKRNVVMSVPFEAITDPAERNRIMKEFLLLLKK